MAKKKKGTPINLGRIIPKPTSELKPKEQEKSKKKKKKE
jgi:hypothetical protein